MDGSGANPPHGAALCGGGIQDVPLATEVPVELTHSLFWGRVPLGVKRSHVQVRGAEGMTVGELASALEDGAGIVVYSYAISIIVMTFRRSSTLIFIGPGKSRLAAGARYTLTSLLFGWWGFPWGPIMVIQSLVTNLRGGKDATAAIIPVLIEESLARAREAEGPSAADTRRHPG
jgi:hypothetical protein